jgi:hypothetical protein
MHRPATTVFWLAFFITPGFAQASAKAHVEPVEFEMMTRIEVKAATHEYGKSTALFYNADTEQCVRKTRPRLIQTVAPSKVRIL